MSKQEIEAFREMGWWQWDSQEIIERHAFIAGMLHVSPGQLTDALEDVALSRGEEYGLFIYHLCILLKSLDLHRQRGEQV